MRVLFIKNLRGQGNIGEIKEVKDGYAKNYLIKNGYAEMLTEKSKASYDRKVERDIKQDEKQRAEAKVIAEKLEKKPLLFKVKTGNGDKVFGSISPKQIKEELAKQGFSIDKKQIELEHSLSSLGFHNVNIRVYKDVVAVIKVQLTK